MREGLAAVVALTAYVGPAAADLQLPPGQFLGNGNAQISDCLQGSDAEHHHAHGAWILVGPGL